MIAGIYLRKHKAFSALGQQLKITPKDIVVVGGSGGGGGGGGGGPAGFVGTRNTLIDRLKNQRPLPGHIKEEVAVAALEFVRFEVHSWRMVHHSLLALT